MVCWSKKNSSESNCFSKFQKSSSLTFFVVFMWCIQIEEVIIICAPDSSLISSLSQSWQLYRPICHHKKSFSAARGPPAPLFSFFNNLGSHETSFMFSNRSGGLEETRGRACCSTPPPSLPSASWPQPRPRHQRQVEWNHEITGKVSITLWNQALSKSRQDPAGPWN